MNRQHAFLANRNASPKVDYNDSIRAILYSHNPRLAPVVQETLEKISYDRILDIYKERFSDAANFKTVIIGNYDEQELRSLLCQYLAVLPATNKHEQANKNNIPQNGPLASSVDKVKQYLVKQYAQAAITNDYWSYIIWHEIDDDTDFDKDYCKMVNDIKPADIQRMAQQILAAKRCIEVTMLSE